MFKKSIVTPRGSIANFHGISEIKAKFPEDIYFSAIVSSYSSEGDYLQKISPVKKTEVFIPISITIGVSFIDSLEQWLINNNDLINIFYGGEFKSPMPTDPLEYAKDKQKAIIKSNRDISMALIDGDLPTIEISAIIDNIKTTYQDLENQIMSATDIITVESIVGPPMP